MTEKTGTVYVLLDPRGDTIRYVGQTTRPLPQRLSGHLSSRGTPMAAWVADLRGLGLRPGIRSIVEDVPEMDLLNVEQAEIMDHIRAGWPLLNAEARSPRMPDVRIARRQVEKARSIGGTYSARQSSTLTRSLAVTLLTLNGRRTMHCGGN
jgi:hypothetical protein